MLLNRFLKYNLRIRSTSVNIYGSVKKFSHFSTSAAEIGEKRGDFLRQDAIYCHDIDLWPPELLPKIAGGREDAMILNDFINVDEERSFEKETHQQLRRLRYENEHWDDAIWKYREIEKSSWTPVCQAVIKRVQSVAFPSDANLLHSVHVLDLAEDGYIKPHIDSVRYCGDVIAGLSLLSDAVMRLVHKDDKKIVFDLHMARRSLYILKGVARYDFTHAVLPDAESFFKGLHVKRGRRLAVICRALPKPGDNSDSKT